MRLARVHNRGGLLDEDSADECSREETETILHVICQWRFGRNPAPGGTGLQTLHASLEEVEGIWARANALSAKFPNGAAFWEVAAGRTVQS